MKKYANFLVWPGEVIILEECQMERIIGTRTEYQ